MRSKTSGISHSNCGAVLGVEQFTKVGPIMGWSFEAPVTYGELLIEPMYITKGSLTVNSQYKTRTSIP